MEFVLLGGVAVLGDDGSALDLGPARQRCVLAALAVDAGRVVSVDRLIDRVWGENPPLRARATLLNYLSRLRLLLADAAAVVRRPGGYTLQAERSAVDVVRFHDLCDRARAAEDGQAVVLLRQALKLWRGEALTGVDGEWADAERDRLHQQRLDAECELTGTLLRLGRGEDLVATLTTRAAQWPWDERVAGQLVLALHRAGRTTDALAHYRHLRDRLVEQLGTEPGTALQDLHQRILDSDPALTPPSAAAKAGDPVPRQLPAPPRWFTGRDTELARLDQALSAEPDEAHPPSETGSRTRTAATVVISAIGGAGGIGKTWLALAWAHQHAEQFPGGQLFVDLHGFSPTQEPTAPEVAVRGFLDALGVDPGRIPADLDAQAALYRSLVAGKRMLIVLDNAATTDQVTPLLPGSPTCTVLVTGRTRLASLIDRHGARDLQLDVLSRADARALLTARLGAGRVAAEADAVDELIELCGGYPLALSITARNAAHPALPLAEIAADLRELGLEALDHDTDPAASLPAVLSWSLRRLTDEHRTVFALLGIAPGPDTTLPAVAALTGLSPARARKALSALEEASLVERRPHGRYAMHDLIRRYATDTARQLPGDVAEEALRRVVDFYVHTAHVADRLLNPHRPAPRFDPPGPDCHPQPVPDPAAALAWFDAEHACLLAAQHTATTHHWHHDVWHLAWALTAFHGRRGNRQDQLAVWQAGLAATEHLHDPTTRAQAHRYLGSAHALLGRHDEAVGHLRQSLTLAEQHHDPTNQSHAHRMLAWAWELRGDYRQALEHSTRALSIFRTLGNPVWEAWALNEVGWHHAQLGDHDQARDHCSAALTVFRHHPEPDSEANTWDSLGYIDHHTGNHERAVHHYRQALTLYRDLHSEYQIAGTLDHLGHPHAALGQHDQARKAWQEALLLYREQGRDADAARVQRQLDDLASVPQATRPSDTGETTQDA